MKKRKKNVEPIVINSEPLSTTTIGSLEIKENGPIFVIVGVAIFLACIIGLPYITDWIQNLDFSGTTTIPVNSPTAETPSGDVEENLGEDKYYTLENNLVVILNGFQFSKFQVNNTAKTISFEILNQNGDSNLFVEKNFYLELYTSDTKLLERIRLTQESLSGQKSFTYDITDALASGTISQIAIVTKEDTDYPPVDLGTNQDNEPILTCQKGNELITYTFKSEKDRYYLIQIEEQASYLSSDSNYNTYLQEYTALSNNYLGIRGVSTTLTPTATGFAFKNTIQLETISVSDYKRLFTKDIYYDRNTEAKVIAFELNASGYTCE